MPPKTMAPARDTDQANKSIGDIDQTPIQRTDPFAVDASRASGAVRDALERSSMVMYAFDMQQTLMSDRTRQIAKRYGDIERLLNASKQVLDNHGKEIIELQNKHINEIAILHQNATEEVDIRYKTRLDDAHNKNLMLKKEIESALKEKNNLMFMMVDAILDICNMHVMFFNSSPWRSFYGEPVYEYFKQYFMMIPLPGNVAFPVYESDMEISALLDGFADEVSKANAQMNLSAIKTYVYDCASGLLSIRLPGVPHPQGLAEMKCGSRILTPQAQEAALANEGDGYYAINFNNVIGENNEMEGYAAFKSSLMYVPLKYPVFEASATRGVLLFDAAEAARAALDQASTRAMLAVTRAPSADLEGIRLRSARESKLAIALNNINNMLGITEDMVTINADDDRIAALVKKSTYAVNEILKIKDGILQGAHKIEQIEQAVAGEHGPPQVKAEA